MRQTITALLATVLLTACSVKAPERSENANFIPHSYVQSNMVVQRNQTLTLWGKAAPGTKVLGKASWNCRKFSAVARPDSIFEVKIPVRDCIKGHPAQTIKLYNETGTFCYDNILIGDVWVLGGQSNMGISLCDAENGKEEAAGADFPMIRYYHIPLHEVGEPVYEWADKTPKWLAVTPDVADWMSAIGYFFAKTVYEKTQIPIGVINTCMGGTTIQSMMDPEVVFGDERLARVFGEPFKDFNIFYRTGGMFNNFVYPVYRASVKGFVWYQGEANWSQYEDYPYCQQVLMNEWRKNYTTSPDAPFYYFQLAPYAYDCEGNAEAIADPKNIYPEDYHGFLALMHEAQASFRELDPNTGMVCLLDAGDPCDIHPRFKKQAGERAAFLALSKTYGFGDIVCEGPRFKDFKVEDGHIKISFTNAEGLRTNDGKAPRFFMVSPSTEPLFRTNVNAEIVGEEVWLSAPGLISEDSKAEDFAVRYAFLPYPSTNLENGAGLPAESFRTDSWTFVHYITE